MPKREFALRQRGGFRVCELDRRRRAYQVLGAQARDLKPIIFAPAPAPEDEKDIIMCTAGASEA